MASTAKQFITEVVTISSSACKLTYYIHHGEITARRPTESLNWTAATDNGSVVHDRAAYSTAVSTSQNIDQLPQALHKTRQQVHYLLIYLHTLSQTSHSLGSSNSSQHGRLTTYYTMKRTARGFTSQLSLHMHSQILS